MMFIRELLQTIYLSVMIFAISGLGSILLDFTGDSDAARSTRAWLILVVMVSISITAKYGIVL